jgi:hypothetical protein
MMNHPGTKGTQKARKTQVDNIFRVFLIFIFPSALMAQRTFSEF